MKTNIFTLFIIISLFMVSCDSSKGKSKELSQHTEQHSEDDGHGHGPEQKYTDDEDSEGDHAEEIVLSESLAKEVGLETEVATAASFRNIIKTSGQIQFGRHPFVCTSHKRAR